MAVRAALSALPGAGWTDVRHLDVPLGPDCLWLEVFRKGSAERPTGEEWRRAHDLLRRVVLEAIGSVPSALQVTTASVDVGQGKRGRHVG